MSGVFYEPAVKGASFPVTKEKISIKLFHSNWSVRYENPLREHVDHVKVHIIHEGPYSLVNKFGLTLNLNYLNYKTMETQVVKFTIENPDESNAFKVYFPKFDVLAIEITGELTILDPGCISSMLGFHHDLTDSGRPHDIVLNFEDGEKMYCNKVVLAFWSNYFDRLFFSKGADPKVSTFHVPELKSEAVKKLLEKVLDISTKNFETGFGSETSCDIEILELKAACILEVTVVQNFVRCNMGTKVVYNKANNMSFKERSEQLMVGLELAQSCSLSGLKKSSAEYFRNNFLIGEKTNFFTLNSDRLRNLDIQNLVNIMDEGFSLKSDEWSEFVRLLKETDLNTWKPETYKANIQTLKNVTLVVGNEKFKVHKEYLAFWSPFFDRLFFGDFVEKNKMEIKLKEINPEMFKLLLTMIYTPSSTCVHPSNVVSLLKLADRFEMKSIMVKCEKSLVNLVEGKCHGFFLSFIKSLELADTYNLIDAQVACLNKINKMNLEESKKFRQENSARLAMLSPRMLKNIFTAL